MEKLGTIIKDIQPKNIRSDFNITFAILFLLFFILFHCHELAENDRLTFVHIIV